MMFDFKEKGIKATIIEKPEHEMIGFKKSANEGDGSLDRFVSQLIKSGKTDQLSQASSDKYPLNVSPPLVNYNT